MPGRSATRLQASILSVHRPPAFPAYGERSKVLRDRARSPVSLYGTAYLWTAGLMNLLLLFEVWDIALRRRDP